MIIKTTTATIIIVIYVLSAGAGAAAYIVRANDEIAYRTYLLILYTYI